MSDAYMIAKRWYREWVLAGSLKEHDLKALCDLAAGIEEYTERKVKEATVSSQGA